MRKIMLVIEEHIELVALENLLRRMGFDVLSLAKELLVNDALLRFIPDIVIATARGRHVDGYRLASRLRKLQPSPRVVLCFQAGESASVPAERNHSIDALIELPLQPVGLINILSQLSGIDPAPLLDKYEKLTGFKVPREELQFVTGEGPKSPEMIFVTQASPEAAVAARGWDPVVTPGKASEIRSERSSRYDRFLEEHDEPVDNVLPKEASAEAMKKLKKEAQKDKSLLDQIDEEKRAFAKSLFQEGAGKPGPKSQRHDKK